MEDILRRFFRAIDDLGDVAQVNGFAAEDADHDVADVLHAGQERAGLDGDVLVVAGETAGSGLTVRLAQHRDDSRRAEIARGEAAGIEQHANLASRSADERGFGDELDLFHRVIDLRCDAPKREMIVAFTVEGERENGDVVDGPRLDHRVTDAVRDAIEVRLKFLVEFGETVLRVLADLEPHDDEALAGL